MNSIEKVKKEFDLHLTRLGLWTSGREYEASWAFIQKVYSQAKKEGRVEEIKSMKSKPNKLNAKR